MSLYIYKKVAVFCGLPLLLFYATFKRCIFIFIYRFMRGCLPMINKLIENAQKNIIETEQKQNKSRTNREQDYPYYYTRENWGYRYYYTRFCGVPLLLHKRKVVIKTIVYVKLGVPLLLHAIFTPTLTTTYKHYPHYYTKDMPTLTTTYVYFRVL